MRLPPPDPLSIILLYLAAIVMALKEALAPGSALAAKAPALTMAGVWSYVPAILLCIAAVVWIARGARATPHVSPQTANMLADQTSPARPLLPAHEPLRSEQVHHLLYFGMVMLAMVSLNALSRCDHQATPVQAFPPTKAAPKAS